MTLRQLADFIKETNQKADLAARTESVQRFHSGHAVYLAHRHSMMRHGQWGKWCDMNKINRMTANRAERLYEAATTKWAETALENVAQHRLTDLYVQFNILRTPSEATAPAASPQQPTPGHAAPEALEPEEPAPEAPEPDLGTLGTLRIGPSGVVAKAEADAFKSVSAVDRSRKLLVCRTWDARARAALARGVAVLLLPEFEEECRP